MKFNWIFSKDADQDQKKRCIDLEYQLRPRITRFLLEHFENEYGGDFSCFHFDVFVDTEKVTMGNNTPEKYLRLYSGEFDRIFNGIRKLTVA